MYIVLADDLTGAMDTGIQFRKYGIQTSVIVSADDCELRGDSCAGAVSINNSSRELSGSEAYEKHCGRSTGCHCLRRISCIKNRFHDAWESGAGDRCSAGSIWLQESDRDTQLSSGRPHCQGGSPAFAGRLISGSTTAVAQGIPLSGSADRKGNASGHGDGKRYAVFAADGGGPLRCRRSGNAPAHCGCLPGYPGYPVLRLCWACTGTACPAG